MDKRSPRPGGRPERLGYTQVCRDPPPPSRATCPSPGAASERRSTPTPPREIGAPLHLPRPHEPGRPPKIGLGRGLWPGGGRSGLTGAAAAAAARTPAARRGARSAPPPAPGAGPPLLPGTPLLPLRTCGLKAEIARLLGGRRESSPGRSVRDPGRFLGGSRDLAS